MNEINKFPGRNPIINRSIAFAVEEARKTMAATQTLL